MVLNWVLILAIVCCACLIGFKWFNNAWSYCEDVFIYCFIFNWVLGLRITSVTYCYLP